MDEIKKESVIQVISMVPCGCVATYGQIARLAGLGRGARYVGTILKQLPNGTKLPWHRIINSQGRISLTEGSEGHNEQQARLRREGIIIKDGKINLKTYGWKT